MKPYLFTYSQLCPEVLAHKILDESSAISYWVQPFPNAAIITSSLDVNDLSAILHNRLGNTWFLISELSKVSVNGWLPENLWQLVSAPALASSQGLIRNDGGDSKGHADSRGRVA